jgi:hypothetical protein
MFAYVLEGQIAETFGSLPDAVGNVSNPAALSEQDRKALGLYEVIDNPPTLGAFEHAVRVLVFDAASDTVMAQYTVTADDTAFMRRGLWERVKQRRQACIEGGAKVTIGTDSKWFHTDLFSRTQWLGLVVLGQSLPVGVQWKCMDNSFVELTPTVVQQVFAAIQTKEQAAFVKAEMLRAAIDAAADPRAVDITAGWPESYQ